MNDPATERLAVLRDAAESTIHRESAAIIDLIANLSV